MELAETTTDRHTRRFGALEEMGRAAGLSLHQRAVLRHLAEGRSNRDIARRLNLSEGKVGENLKTIGRKLAERWGGDPGLTVRDARDLLACMAGRRLAEDPAEVEAAEPVPVSVADREDVPAIIEFLASRSRPSDAQKPPPGPARVEPVQRRFSGDRAPAPKPHGLAPEDLRRRPAEFVPSRLVLEYAYKIGQAGL
jgi:DNA-binding CsgD family transcriptional regulator